MQFTSILNRLTDIGRATTTYANGYGVSIVRESFHSNGLEVFEVAVLVCGRICYTTGITSDVLKCIGTDELQAVVRRVEGLLAN